MELNKYAVMQQIENECQELQVMVEKHEKLVRDSVAKDKAYEIAYAKGWLGLISDPSVKMTVEDKKQRVSESTADDKFSAELAQELSKTMSEAIRVKLETLGAHRSILSSLKSEEENQPAEDPSEKGDDSPDFPDWVK